MKLREASKVLGAALAAFCLLSSSGCGGKGSTANVITVTLNSSAGPAPNLILGQSVTITATVGGTSNTNVNWTPPCQWTKTTTDSTGKMTTSTPAKCPQDTSFTPPDDNHTIFGVFSNQQATGTEVFTAASNLPDPKTYPGLQIIATAQSQQDTKKTGTIKITLNSGIGIAFTPGTASVAVNEPQTFNALLVNDIGKTTGVTWSITQNVPDSTFGSTPNPYTPLPTCTVTNPTKQNPGCGSIASDPNNPNTVVYTAPLAVPSAITPAQKNNTNSPANVTLVAVSNADPTRVTIGTITIIPGGPITFKTISPTIAPLGATLWDIYLDAPNISSASTITLTDSAGGATLIKSDSGQIKVLFPVPTSPSSSSSSSSTPVTCSSSTPCSTGARIRLIADNLKTPGPVTISVTDPQPTPVTQCTGTPLPSGCTAPGVFTFNVLPVRPTSLSTVPDDIVPNAQNQSFPITINGGYFGPGSSHGNPTTNFVSVFFQSPANPTLTVDPNRSTSNQLFVSLPATDINPSNPGLYPLYVASRATNPAPTPSNPSVTNMAIFPDYSTSPPAVSTSGILAGTNPSAVDIDADLGVLVVAETGSNAVEFFSIGNKTLTSLGQVTSTAVAPINVPIGVSVNRTNHTVAVVNYGSQTVSTANNTCQVTFPSPPGQPGVPGQTVTVLPIPGAPPPPPGTPAPTAFSVDLTGALQGSVCPAPMPYSIGVDPDSNLALVAYSSTSSSSASNLGFIVNLNPNTADANGKPTNPYGCTLGQAINANSNKDGQCLFAQVTLNTGTYPQVAVAPHGHSALVTPGGSGFVRGVDVTKPSNANFISGATLSGGFVTVIVDTTKCPNGITATGPSKNPCPLLMVPGAAGSVLISGLTPGTATNNAFFNGVFTVNVTSNSTFTYPVPNTTATDSCKPPTGSTSCGGEVFYGSPDQILGLSPTSQGVAINPITSITAIADADATGNNGAQINLLNGLDQTTLLPITFSPNCTAFTTTCATSFPESLPTADVAWQPFTNSLVSYNPHLNQVSVSDPVSHRRYAFACASSTACTANTVTPSQITLSGGIGAGTVTLTDKTVPAIQNGTTNSLTLFGGLAVDPVTNQAFIVKSGSGTIDIVDLTGAAAIKATHISEVIVPTPSSSAQGSIGGIPNALVPQATLTCTTPVPPATSCDLPNVRILGSGFASPMTVRLDGIDITTQGGTVGTPLNGGREVDVTIPASLLKVPHHYALDVLSSNAQSNAVDFLVIQQIDLSNVCPNSSGTAVNTMPSSVAIADQIANGPFSPFALVSVTGCNSVVRIDLNPASPTFGQLTGSPISVGTNPQGIAIWQRQGLAVVANNGSGTASVIDLTQNPPGPPNCAASSTSGSTGTVPCPAPSTGTNPSGVAINEATGAAIIANTASNTVTMLNLGLLFPQPGASLPTAITPVSIGGIQEPTAVAIDPDRGPNSQGIAVVTAVVLSSGFAPSGALAVVNIGTAIPALSTTSFSGSTASIPTGVVFDPAVNISSTNPSVVPGAFFANSSGTNSITEFIPEGGGGPVSVGINPTSLAVNPQTGALLTANSASNTISIVDTTSIPLKTRQTLGIPGSPTFGVAIDQFTNLAVIVDQANMRVLLFPMPN